MHSHPHSKKVFALTRGIDDIRQGPNNFGNFVKFWANLLKINLSGYFQASYFSRILQFPQQQICKSYGIKKCDGGKSKLMNFFKSLRKNPSRIPFVINLRKFRGRVGYGKYHISCILTRAFQIVITKKQ